MSSVLSRTQSIRVIDAKSFDRWMASAPLADPDEAGLALTQLLEDLEAEPRTERHALGILEQLQEPVGVVIEALVRRFAGRPVPLSDSEAHALTSTHELLLAYGRGYKRHLQQLIQKRQPTTPKRDIALAAFRAEECATRLASAYYRARHELPADVWQDLCGVHRLVLAEGVEEERVANSRPRSCAEAFGAAVLTHLTLPYGRSARALDLVEQAANMLAMRVALQTVEKAAAGIVVDLEEGNAPAFRQLTGSKRTPGLRLVDLRSVKRPLVRAMEAIEGGTSISETELPISCTRAEAEALLPDLQKAWFESARARDFRRRVVTDRVNIVLGFASIHDAIGGKVQKTEQRRNDLTEAELARMTIFGSLESAAARDDANRTTPPEGLGERWELLDESPVGFRVRRRARGARVQQHQLVGIKSPSAKQYMIAEVRWLTAGADGSLMMGLRALSGVAVPASLMTSRADYSWSSSGAIAGFLLESVNGAEQRLVVPRNTFAADAFVDIIADARIQRTKVKAVEQQGVDFEVLSFAARE